MNLTGRAPYQKGSKPKKSRTANAGRLHMVKVKLLPCVICRSPPPNDAHHCFHDRYGTHRASNWQVIPLCKECHQSGIDAIHKDKKGWLRRHGPDWAFIPAVMSLLGYGTDDF